MALVQQFTPFLVLLATLALFWMLVVRPAKRQQQAVAAVQSALEVGQRVVLSSGIYGTITELADDTVHLQIAEGTVIEVARAAVLRKAGE